MSFFERLVEDKVSKAIERGEFDQGAYAGRPLPDLDTPRQPGWWAERFVARERERLRQEDAEMEATRRRRARRIEPEV